MQPSNALFLAHWQPYEDLQRCLAYRNWRTRLLWQLRPRCSQARRQALAAAPFAQPLASSGGASRMASSAHEFKARTRKSVTLPSGLEVDIRKVVGRDFVGLGELPIPAAGEVDRHKSDAREQIEQIEQMKRYSDRAIVRGALAPRFTDDPAKIDAEHEVHLSYLDDDDYTALARAIFDFAGLTKETADAVESFRQNEVSPTLEGTGGAVQQGTA